MSQLANFSELEQPLWKSEHELLALLELREWVYLRQQHIHVNNDIDTRYDHASTSVQASTAKAKTLVIAKDFYRHEHLEQVFLEAPKFVLRMLAPYHYGTYTLLFRQETVGERSKPTYKYWRLGDKTGIAHHVPVTP
jgi:hypothetical protein